ncbi:GCN5-related N-acetyltransferase 7, chloroplastic isoform X4 [Elaeis guineensis]|uniref:Uncharacterized protein LOC105039220 isoform X2 n=1 Tax=Elaeis guineensis var. tenera TaxID=51953 RepID=A0A6I9QUM7_ELAGV|nr:uncharacterized protein LOC105039220 isoform X2 [Elaeis guineensis]
MMLPLLSQSAAPLLVPLPSAHLLYPSSIHRWSQRGFPNPNPNPSLGCSTLRRELRPGSTASHLCEREALTLDGGSLSVKESSLEEELWAAVRLRVRTFYEFKTESCGIEDYTRYLTEREFEALKDRIAGKRIGLKRVSCINATLPISPFLASADELCSACKFSNNGEERVVVGTLDLNQCLRLTDELTGKRPEVLGSDIMRAYLSNVCVAKELQRNGLGYALVSKSKKVAREWGISDLYVHVAVDNEAAQKLYQKSGFVYENEEPAWQARFLGRPRRFLLWADLTQNNLRNSQEEKRIKVTSEAGDREKGIQSSWVKYTRP